MGNLNHLPDDIVLDIITRLPTESLLDCKLVCRPWRILVSYHPSFSRLHLTHHLNSSTGSGKLGFIVVTKKESAEFHYFEYIENHGEETPVASIRRINLTIPFTGFNSCKVLGSVNGLVCLYGWADTSFCIFNPMTRECVMLPSMKRNCDDYPHIHYWSGFGYLPSTNEYKVVLFYLLWSALDFIEVVVYTLGTGKGWRNVGRFDSSSLQKYTTHCASANGVLHWVHKRDGSIMTMDLTEEKFDYLSPPHSPPNDCTVGVLNGVLYWAVAKFDFNARCTRLDIWLLKKNNDISDMKEQVEQEPSSWSKMFTLPEGEPLAITKSGDVLRIESSRFLSIYDAKASTSKKLVDVDAYARMFPHKNTLVSLKELREEGIKLMERAETKETDSQDLPKIPGQI